MSKSWAEVMTDEAAEMSETVFNLRLYLTYLKNCGVEPDKWAALEDRFDGLPGFVEIAAGEE